MGRDSHGFGHRPQFSSLFLTWLCALACSGSTSDAADSASGAGGSSAAAARGGTGAAGADSGGTTGATSGSGGIGGQPDSGMDSGGPCGPDPSGCVETGCPQGKACDPSQGCRPSACLCDPSAGTWGCTADCNGGTCVEPECVGCPPEFPLVGSSCAGFPAEKRCTYAQQTGRCEWHTGGTSSGRHVVTCTSTDGSLEWK
jgi:hypothetical protein